MLPLLAVSVGGALLYIWLLPLSLALCQWLSSVVWDTGRAHSRFRVYLFMLGFLCFCMVLSTDILGGDLGCELLELMALFAEWISGRALAGTWGLQMIPEITMLLLVLCQVCVCMCVCAMRHLPTRELNLVAPH